GTELKHGTVHQNERIPGLWVGLVLQDAYACAYPLRNDVYCIQMSLRGSAEVVGKGRRGASESGEPPLVPGHELLEALKNLPAWTCRQDSKAQGIDFYGRVTVRQEQVETRGERCADRACMGVARSRLPFDRAAMTRGKGQGVPI